MLCGNRALIRKAQQFGGKYEIHWGVFLISPVFSNSSLLLCSTLVMWVARLVLQELQHSARGCWSWAALSSRAHPVGVCVYPHTPSELWAWKPCTDPNPDPCRIAHCTVFPRECKPLFSSFQAGLFPRPGSSQVPFWEETMWHGVALALCRVLSPPNLLLGLGNTIPSQHRGLTAILLISRLIPYAFYLYLPVIRQQYQ